MKLKKVIKEEKQEKDYNIGIDRNFLQNPLSTGIRNEIK